MRVVVTGYTYTRENLFDVFLQYPERENLFFILPNNWTAKGGSVVFPPIRREGFHIWHSPAFFSHSEYPLIGGLLKGWMPFFVVRLLWLRIARGADVLYTAGEPNLLSTLYNALWARLLGMKHVIHFWENIPYEQKDRGMKLWIKRALIRLNLALSHGVICGMHKAEDILRSFGSHVHAETFLHAGFDETRFLPGVPAVTRTSLGWGAATVFLYVGALGYRKGIHLALQGVARLREDGVDARMLIVGSGEYGDELKELARELRLQEYTHFIPWLSNDRLPEIYASADVVLYPSIPYRGWEEQFGYVIAEASLCGRPVISTKTGSIDEVLVDGGTGLLVSPNDTDALSAAMRYLAENPGLRERMGARGRQFVVERFSNRVIAQKLFTLFTYVATN